MFQFIAKVFSGNDIRTLPLSGHSTSTVSYYVFMDLALYTVSLLSWNRFGPGNLNASECNGILGSYLHQGKRFGKAYLWLQWLCVQIPFCKCISAVCSMWVFLPGVCSISVFLLKSTEECFMQEVTIFLKDQEMWWLFFCRPRATDYTIEAPTRNVMIFQQGTLSPVLTIEQTDRSRLEDVWAMCAIVTLELIY